ncbi:MAG TPA: response regulator [Blastocatellia bacterium]|nr:response regulator [Blastocatellia bacterium]
MINAIDASIEERQRTVLIVDDFPEDRRVYQRYFLKDEERRYKTLEAGTGEEAIAIFRESRPDCVLLDYRLPDLNGMEVLAAIAGDCDEAVCPVVMLTAEEDIAVAVEALKSGAQDYLNKNTLTAIELLHSVNRAIERVALRRENADQRRALLEQNRKLEEALAASSRAEEILRRDIAERKRIELERDMLLQREQHARQLAEEANRVKDEFLAVVTHELRSPLNAMLGYARIQCAKKRIDPEEARRDFETIRRNGERQKALIDDLLDTARIITGKLRIEVGPVDLAGVVKNAIETARPAADSKLIQLGLKLDPLIMADGQVIGDSERLRQIVWNLLTNAIKFTPEGGQVEVRLERLKSRVSLTVRDTGSGIAPEFLPHIFDRFTQQDTSPSRRYSGLGLGLALVKQLVEMHGGEIKATSAGEGHGATFTLSLPVTADRETGRRGDRGTGRQRDGETEGRGDREMETGRQGDGETGRRRDEFLLSPCPPVPLSPRLPVSPSPCLPVSPSPSLPLSGVGVLIVDDEEEARRLVAKVLEESGANVVAVSSAVEAFAMITEPPRPDWPDALVCDIALPEEDGYSLMRRIRDWELGRGVHLPSVALTALNRAEDRLNALGAGYKMHIAKPFEAEELITVVKNLVTAWRETGGSSK